MTPLTAFLMFAGLVGPALASPPFPSTRIPVMTFGNFEDFATSPAHNETDVLSKRETGLTFCLPGQFGDYNVKDARDLQAHFQNNNPENRVPLPRRDWVGWHLGTASICIYNFQFSSDFEIKNWEIGWSVSAVLDICCKNNPTRCRGGGAECHTINGKSLGAVLMNSAYDCNDVIRKPS